MCEEMFDNNKSQTAARNRLLIEPNIAGMTLLNFCMSTAQSFGQRCFWGTRRSDFRFQNLK